MNFEWINKQGVKTESGIIVQFTGRFTAEYREGYKMIEIKFENGTMGNKHCIYFNRSDFNKWNIGDGILTIEEQEKRINIFKEAIIFQGLMPLDE